MIHLTLLPQHEKLAPRDPVGLEYKLLYHQLRTYEALAEYDLVVNAYDTGTGKTVASLLHLTRMDNRGKNVLFIAPTNALIHQHVESIRRFVDEQGLAFRVLEVNAALLRQMMENQRPGETLQRLIQNPLTYAQALNIPADDHRKLPIILVVNPDIFYYALYHRYHSHDKRNVFEKFLTAFDYIVIDEFHYYDSKQLANFLFFFVISKKWGYFQNGRKICLLSATPNTFVLEYLGRVFTDKEWALIWPDTESEESDDYPTELTLTELELDLVAADLQDWVLGHRTELANWLDAGQDGAIISSALWRVNTCYSSLRGTVGADRLGRITGPESEERRQQVTGFPLILATPTVDIGYNFDKQAKERQNLDFLICDARYGDELRQRLGRAGRVLGKTYQNIPGRAIALLGDDACQELAEHDGERLSRAEFAEIIAAGRTLPPKQTLYAYIRTHAITECFYPLYQTGRIMPDHLQAEIEALYELVREVFTPHSKKSSISLRAFYSKHWYRQKWLQNNQKTMTMGIETARHVADWIRWREDVIYKPSDILPALGSLLENEKERQRLRQFVRSQVHLTESLFSFRDSFQGPSAVVYDPKHLLSSQTINRYDLMHILSNFNVRWLDDWQTFAREYGQTDLRGEFYGVLDNWREPRLSMELWFQSPWTRAEFNKRVCRRPIALTSFRLTARQRGGDAYPLDTKITNAISGDYITVLGITPTDSPIVYGKFRGSSLYSRRLVVEFPDGSREEDYRAFLGTQAFHAHAELRGYFYMKDRLESEAIII